MKIELTKEQYKELVFMSGIANYVCGILGDSLPDGYKKRSRKMHELQEFILQHADEFDYKEFLEKSGGKNEFTDDWFNKKMSPIMSDYDDCQMDNALSKALAWRDFEKDHSKQEIKEMEKKNGGYFGVALYAYEKRYWNEFEKHGFERLEVKE